MAELAERHSGRNRRQADTEHLRAEARARVASIPLLELAPIAEMAAAELAKFLQGGKPEPRAVSIPRAVLRELRDKPRAEPTQNDSAEAQERSHALRLLVSCLPTQDHETAAWELLRRVLAQHVASRAEQAGWLRQLTRSGPFL